MFWSHTQSTKSIMSLCMQGHFLDEMEVATTAIDEATILQIKTTVALLFQSSLTMLVVQWWQRNLPKSVLHVQGFSLLIFLFSSSLWYAELARRELRYYSKNVLICDDFAWNHGKRATKSTSAAPLRQRLSNLISLIFKFTVKISILKKETKKKLTNIWGRFGTVS